MLLSNNYVDGYFYPRAYKTPHWKWELTNLKNSYFKTHKSCFQSCEKNVQLFILLEHQCSVKNSVRMSYQESIQQRRRQRGKYRKRTFWRLLGFDINWDIQRFWMDVMRMSSRSSLSLHLLLDFFLLRILPF